MFTHRGKIESSSPIKTDRAKSLKALLALVVLGAMGSQMLPAQAQNVGDIVTGQVLNQLLGGNQRNRSRRQLPPVQMDSFVDQAGGAAELIYGDEGADGLPPYFGFNASHRIDNGIQGIRDAGLTTGHGSLMPSAWGGDEYIGAEWADTNRGHARNNYGGEGLDAAALAQAAAAALAQGAIAGGTSSGGAGTPNGLPEPPGPGYQPATVHGQFVGYYSPEEVALAQTDFPAAFEAFVYSGRYLGSAENARFILENEMGRPQGNRVIPGL